MSSALRAPEARANFKADPSTTRNHILAYRSRKASALRSLQESVNFHRSLLSLRPRDFASVDASSSQPHSPEFPPHDEMIVMSEKELRTWQKKKRRERVNIRHKEKSRQKNAMVQELHQELADLKRRIQERNRNETAARGADEEAAVVIVLPAENPEVVVIEESTASPGRQSISGNDPVSGGTIEPETDRADSNQDLEANSLETNRQEEEHDHDDAE